MPERPEADLLDSIRMVIRLARIAQQACEDGGLTLAQYRALNSASRGGRRAYEIAQATAVTRPAVTSLTNGMVRAGLVERSDDAADGRGVIFSMTEHGAAVLGDVERRLVDRFTEVLGDAAGALAVLYSLELEEALDAQVDRDFGPARLRPPDRTVAAPGQ